MQCAGVFIRQLPGVTIARFPELYWMMPYRMTPYSMTLHPTSLMRTCLALATLVALSCSPSSRDPSSEPERTGWNVLVVLVDTLRADRTSLYGYTRQTSPGLERLTERAVVFDNALSQAGCTFPSVNSMFTSRYPHDFLSRLPRRLGIPEEIPTIAEILREEGYDTAAISSSRIVRATPSARNRFGGFESGFDLFDESCEGRGATCVRLKTIESIDRLKQPFFVYTHFMEPHGPYSPPKWHERQFATGTSDKGWVRRGVPTPIRNHLYRNGPQEYDERDLTFLSDLYDEEILHFDRQFELFLQELSERGLDENTLLVITSDHGEALLENGEFAHCRSIAYNSVLRTPLMIALPRGSDGATRAAGRRESLAQNLDLVPTILDYTGISTEGFEFEGRSLRPSVEFDRPVHRYLFASQGVMRVITDGQHKLIYDLEEESHELFDWVGDPAETTDLAASEPETADRLQSVLFAWIEEVEGDVGSEASLENARQIEEQLRAVGYL